LPPYGGRWYVISALPLKKVSEDAKNASSVRTSGRKNRFEEVSHHRLLGYNSFLTAWIECKSAFAWVARVSGLVMLKNQLGLDYITT